MNVFLHIMHGWGGGLETWVRDFSSGDDKSRHIILKAIGNWGAFGEGLLLLDSVDSESPLRYWNLKRPIKATAIQHPIYRDIVKDILKEYGVTHIIISSLIGHSLDIFETRRPILHVLHDYYPFCPALNIYFGSICQSCDSVALDHCFKKNANNRFFLNVQPNEWEQIRHAYLKKIGDDDVRLVAPTDDVRSNVERLYGRHVSEKRIEVIPHGIREISGFDRKPTRRERKVLVVPGRMSKNKGLDVYRTFIGALSAVADIHFIGCGAQGISEFSGKPGVTCIEDYQWEELPDIINRIQPDAALLLPTVPETFSYTLSEMWALRVPVIANNIGSMSSRIEHGINGLLIDISSMPKCIVDALCDDQRLSVIRENISKQSIVRIEDMLNAYYQLLGIDRQKCISGEVETPQRAVEFGIRPVSVRQLMLGIHIRVQERIAGLNLSQRNRWLMLAAYRKLVYMPRVIVKKILK